MYCREPDYILYKVSIQSLVRLYSRESVCLVMSPSIPLQACRTYFYHHEPVCTMVNHLNHCQLVCTIVSLSVHSGIGQVVNTLSSALFRVQGAATIWAAGRMEGRTDGPMQLEAASFSQRCKVDKKQKLRLSLCIHEHYTTVPGIHFSPCPFVMQCVRVTSRNTLIMAI